jgi:small conductance mechanosensitive channel
MIEFIADIVTRLRAQFAPDALAGSLAHGASNVVVAFGVFFAFYVLWILVGRALRVALERTHTDQTTASFSLTATKFVVLTLGAVEALSAVGINTAALLTSLGVAGLTIGFAARDALSNLISGVLIFWDRPFVIGDLVEVSGSYGRVDRITLRSTRVVTVDGRMLAVPNSTIINTVVASYTNFPHLRIDVAVTVGTGERIEHVRGVLLALVREDPAYLPDPSPRVVVKSLNDYNVEVELQAWLADEKAHIAARFALRERVLDALTEAGVDMPFETLTIRSPEPRAA